jgi:hypothetical protein
MNSSPLVFQIRKFYKFAGQILLYCKGVGMKNVHKRFLTDVAREQAKISHEQEK